MGQTSSNPTKPTSRRSSLRYPFPRRKNHNNNLSHTFSITDTDQKISLLNVNLASEEELMTLPGVTRETAKNIVEHRKAIGRYRRVEDLALVPGIGADKLEEMRPEICVSVRRNQSGASSRTQSFDSLSAEDRSNKGCGRLLNVNQASVFELQCVPGITQEIAAAIVCYRSKKGDFKRLEDLIKVRSIDRIRLGYITQYLTIEEDTPENITPNGTTNLSFRRLNGGVINGAPFKVQNGLPDSSLRNIFDLLSAYSPRPVQEEKFCYQRYNESCIRIAFWNLHEFTFEKSNNPGVREVTCRTILENGWSIVALQDIVDVSALQLICDELNKPKLHRVADWTENSREWCFSMFSLKNSRMGFLYDTYSGGIDVELSSINDGPVDLDHGCDVIIGTFRVKNITVNIINTKINDLSSSNQVSEKIKELASKEDIILLLGDFSNVSSRTAEWMQIGGLQPFFPEQSNGNNVDNQYISNILGSAKAHSYLTGIWGTVRQGLTHLAIPCGWNWGGAVSPHCPTWIELFVSSSSSSVL